VLHLFDAARPDSDAEVMRAFEARVGRGVPVLTVLNKIDLAGRAPAVAGDRVWLSAKTGAGVGLLRSELKRLAGWENTTSGEHVILARARQVEALERAREHLASAAVQASRGDRALELVAEELRLAGNALAEITGEFTADDLLGAIFSRFCIGK
jgi:tRNA modification GTPase